MFLVLREPFVQTFVSRNLTAYLSEKTNTDFSVEEVKTNLFLDLLIKNVKIKDHNNKIVLGAGKINVDLIGVSLSASRFNFNSLSLEDGTLGLYKYSGDSILSLNRIISSLSQSSEKNDSSKKNALLFEANSIKISGFTFIMVDENKKQKTEGIDFNDMEVSNIDLDMEDFFYSTYNDSTFCLLNRLEAIEKSGFEIKKFSGNIVFTNRSVLIGHMKLITGNSELSMNLGFNYNSTSDFSDFLNKINLQTTIGTSELGFYDIGYFSPELFRMNNKITFSGSFSGPVSNIYARNFKLKYGNKTRLNADIHLRGLPDVMETYANINFEELITDKQDIETFKLPIEGQYLKMPDILEKFGEISLHGTFDGVYNNFKTNTSLHTGLGKLRMDFSLKEASRADSIKYDGHLKAYAFDVGKLLDAEDYFGTTNIDAKMQGSGLTAETLNLLMDGIIDSLSFKGNQFDTIKVDGNLANKMFSGKLLIDDKSVKLDFNGTVNLNKETPEFDFTVDVNDADLYQLGLLKHDTSLLFSTDLMVEFKGMTLDNIIGKVSLKETHYTESGKNYSLDSLILLSFVDTSMVKNIHLHSDYLDLNISGDFAFSDLLGSTDKLIRRYMPSLGLGLDPEEEKKYKQYIDFNARIKNYREISELFVPGFLVSDTASFSGHFNSSNDSIFLQASADTMFYKGLIIDHWYLSNSSSSGSIKLKTGANRLIFRESSKSDSVELGIDQFSLSSVLRNDSIFTCVKWNDSEDSDENKASIKAYVNLTGLPLVEAKITSANAIVNDTAWSISKNNIFKFDTTSISVNDFAIKSDYQTFLVNGNISENPADTMLINFDNWRISNFDLIYSSELLDFDGAINGAVSLVDLYKSPNVITDLVINDFYFNKKKLGNVNIGTSWNNLDQSLNARLQIINVGNFGKSKTLDFNGIYYAGNQSDSLDFTGEMKNFNLSVLNPLTEGVFSDIEGLVSGSFTLSGVTTSPAFDGELRIMRGGLRIDYTNTMYTFSDNIVLDSKGVVFDNLKVHDDYGNIALVNGRLYHNNFDDFGLDVTITPEKVMFLNTNQFQNNMFYGTAYASGKIHIFGPFDNISMVVQALSNEGTNISIPISDKMDVVQKNYIIFVNSSDTSVEEERYNVNLEGLNLNFELSVNPDANINIFLPYQMGNIGANGTGNVKMDINSQGDFTMVGDYKINSGTFLFTLKNLLNKRFEIMQGSAILWTGSPYDADINLRALYQLKTSLDGLGIYVDTTQSFSKRVNVNCIIELKDQLFDPDIRFSIQLPNVDDQTRQLVYSVLDTTNEAEMNQQMISLLVLGSFSYRTEQFSATNASAKLISNQLSNMLSQISKDFDIGVNYRPGDQISEEELEIALSTQLFNNRVLIDGNFGITGDEKSSNASNIVGDMNIEVKLTEDGRFRVKAFNKSNVNSLYDINAFDDIAPYTQGVGIFYREEFNSFKELFQRKRKKVISDPE